MNVASLASVPPKAGSSPFTSLPPEMATAVFQHLGTKGRALAAQVCKLWSGLASAREFIFVPSGTAFKNSSRFSHLRASLRESEFHMSDDATAIITEDNSYQYLTVISKDGEKIYAKSFIKMFDVIFKPICLAWTEFLSNTAWKQNDTFVPVIRPVPDQKLKSIERELDDWEVDRVISSSSTSHGGLAFSLG